MLLLRNYLSASYGIYFRCNFLEGDMSKNFESWALVWLFFIAIGSCDIRPTPVINVYVDGVKQELTTLPVGNTGKQGEVK